MYCCPRTEVDQRQGGPELGPDRLYDGQRRTVEVVPALPRPRAAHGDLAALSRTIAVSSERA